MQKFILGSQSPRRREILSYYSLPFEVVPPQFDEDAIPFFGHPGEFACFLSKAKADSLVDRFADSVILTADTIVYLDGKSYGKPRDATDAKQTLEALSGRWHSVFTGVTLRLTERSFHQFEETKVLFNPLTPFQIEEYIKTQVWADKAGGYAIQNGGSLMIKKLEGCVYNVIGLPVNTVRELFNYIGIDLWHYLKK